MALQFADINAVVSIGGFLFGLSQLIFLAVVVKCVRGGRGKRLPNRGMVLKGWSGR